MKTKKKRGQSYIGRGVSLPIEVSEAVDVRIEALKPWVGGFSDYVRELIRSDLTGPGHPIGEGVTLPASIVLPVLPRPPLVEFPLAA